MSNKNFERNIGNTDAMSDIALMRCLVLLVCASILPFIICSLIIVLWQSISAQGESVLFSLCAQIISSLISLAICAIILRDRIKALFASAKNWRGILSGVAVGVAIFCASFLLGSLLSHTENENQAALLRELSASPLLFAISSVLITPILEELAFRVAIFSPLIKINLPFAYIMSALIFSLMHVDLGAADIWRELISLPNYLVAGTLLAFSYQKFGFWGSVAAHFTNNLMAMIFSIII